MATVTSTTSTPTPTPAKSTASVTTSATNSLLTSLGTGSGVDTASLVTSLVEAQFAAKKAQLTTRLDTVTAQISGVATLKSTLGDFTKALETLVKGGTVASQPVSSNNAVAGVVAQAGAKLAGLSATVTVNQLAAAQTAVSAKVAAPATTTFGTGTLTLKLGRATFAGDGTMASFAGTDKDGDGAEDAVSIAIDGTNNSLAGIAAAINKAKAGVTASVVTDADGGAYLSLKGATGAAQAFTLTGDTSDLQRFDVRPPANGETLGMTISSQARNARMTVDGVTVERATNEASDLVAGVTLNLNALGTVALSATRPTTALTNAVNDLVATYNDVLATIKQQTDPITGVLRGDPAAKNLLRAMQGLTGRTLLSAAGAGSPATLAAIGVRTNRDGSLEVNAAALTAAMTDHPDAVEAMFALNTSGSDGIYAAMQSLQLNATSTVYGLGASTSSYSARRGEVTDAQAKLTDQATAMTARLTQQFSSMNAKVAAYKSTQAFMKQQIDAWSNTKN